jgi:anti-sigma factor RsiW
VSDGLACGRAQELLSDHFEGALDVVLRAEVDAHLQGCAECRSLRAALEEVVGALRSHPVVEPSAGLAERVARASRRVAPRAPVLRPAFGWQRPLRVAAALLLVFSGAFALTAGPESAPVRAAGRLADQAENTVFYVAERKDRVLEDVRILRVVIAAAFEGRLDRVNDRFDDYRKIIERRRAAGAPAPEKKKIGNKQSNSRLARLVGPSGRGKEPGIS